VPRDPYEILGVGRESSEQEIKKAFRRLARELHPDVNAHDPEAETKFKEAAEAYEILSDADRRRTYDSFGFEGLRSGGYEPHAWSGGIEDILRGFFGEDLFGGFGGATRGPRPGADAGVRVEITLEEVLTGVSRQLDFEAVAACEECGGDGAASGSALLTCTTCNGAGEVRQMTRTPIGQIVRSAGCPSCGGRGRIPEESCPRCNGEGREVRDRTWDVQVPPGISTGQRIRIGGAGHAGEAGAPQGDLYVEVTVAEHESFIREGDDLIVVSDVSAPEAMVGTTVDVPMIDGESESIEVDPGTQPGAQKVLRSRGLPHLRSGRRGDLRIIWNVIVPANLSDEQRRTAEDLAESITEANLVPERADGIIARLRRVLG